MIRTDSVTEILESLDFEESKACESIHHGARLEAHGGTATHLQVGNCTHQDGLRCAKYMALRFAGFPTLPCGICGAPPPTTWVPLE